MALTYVVLLAFTSIGCHEKAPPKPLGQTTVFEAAPVFYRYLAHIGPGHGKITAEARIEQGLPGFIERTINGYELKIPAQIPTVVRLDVNYLDGTRGIAIYTRENEWRDEFTQLIAEANGGVVNFNCIPPEGE